MKRIVTFALILIIGITCAHAEQTLNVYRTSQTNVYNITFGNSSFDYYIGTPTLQFRGQRMVTTGVKYSGRTYIAFDPTMPSEYEAGYEGKVQQKTPRRFPHRPDTGQTEDSPIGEAWVLALFGAAFIGVLTLRQWKKHRLQITDMKKNTFIALLAMLLIAVPSKMKADIAYSGGYIYFDNSLGINPNTLQLCGRQSSWTGVSNLSNIANTKLYYVANPQGSGWGGILGWVVISANPAKSNSNFDNWTSYTWCSNWNTYGFNSGSTYLIVPTSTSKNQSVNTSYFSSGYNGLNSTQTVRSAVRPSGGNYATANSKADITITSYKLTGNGTAAQQTTYLTTSASSQTVTAARTATTTYTVGAVASGYEFDGWYTAATGGTLLSSSTTYTHYPTAATTVYARFSQISNLLAVYTANEQTTGDAAIGDWLWTSTSGSVSSKTLTLQAKTQYKFKVIYNGDYYGFLTGDPASGDNNPENPMTIGDHTDWRLFTTGGDCYLYAPVTGDYTFHFNSDNGGNTTLTVDFPTAYPITFGPGIHNGSSTAITATATPSFNSGDYVLTSTAVTFSKGSTSDGYTWKGWYPNADGTGVSWSTTDGNWTSAAGTRTGEMEVYACYTPMECDILLDYQTDKTGYGSKGNISNEGSLHAVFGSPVPTLLGTMPSGSSGYSFAGFYSAPNGCGRLYYNADGTSAANWAIVSNTTATLFAHYKGASIESIDLSATTFEPISTPSGDADKDSIFADPTVFPVPEGDYVICWDLLYSNGNVVDGHEASPAPRAGHPGQVRFSVVGLAAGNYKVRAILRLGTSCDTEEALDTMTVNFRVVNEFKATIRYRCGDYIIQPNNSVSVSPLHWTSVIAPDLVGYKFSTWELSDGINLKAGYTLTNNNIEVNAVYDGTITAHYTKKRLIYFNNTLGWDDVYVYFHKNNGYWHTDNGSGANKDQDFSGNKPYSEQLHGHMQRITGTNIWYFDAEGAGVNASYTTVLFTDRNQHGYNFFWGASEADPTKVVRRDDYHSTTLPMFVPLSGQTPEKKNANHAAYYFNGYWMNYPDNTGYWLKISSGTSYDSPVIKTIPFEFTPDKTMPMSVTVDLEENYTYGFEIYRNDGSYFGKPGKTYKLGDSGDIGQTQYAFSTSGKCGLKTSAAGDYVFRLDYGKLTNYDYIVGVHYPVTTNSYRIVYKDGATWSKDAHNANWNHPSRVLYKGAGNKDTVSFFISQDASPSMKFQYASSINSEGVITWKDVTGGSIDLSSITETGVYNFITEQTSSSISVTRIQPYTGKFYIRTDAVEGKWDNYRTGLDHEMTYSEFSESEANAFGPKYSHYKTKWCPRGTNVKFVIANDYSACISDTLTQDFPNTFVNINADGSLKQEGGKGATEDKYSANIRFMWNRKTNKISRAYLSSATNVDKKFLVLQGQNVTNSKIYDMDGNAFPATSYLDANSCLLNDNQNWIYEIRVRANPSALIKLYAQYCGQNQYFCGTSYPTFEKDVTAISILGGSPSSEKYEIRVLYDFKTNRLVTAWMPDGTDVTGEVTISTDVMIIRKHQNAAECITFANSTSKLTEVRTVYGAMCFNRWTLNNRAVGKGGVEDNNRDHCWNKDLIAEYHPLLPDGEQKSEYERFLYFISLPFDVNLSDVFGFGTYGTHWIISEYNGARRAREGYFADNCHNEDCTNWDYIWDPTGFVLRANQGYLLSLEPELMAYDDTLHFWTNQISQVELFFPSSSNSIGDITRTNYTTEALGDEYRCTINNPTPEGDRRVKDSYWRCIGAPSYNTYGGILTAGKGGQTVEWQTNYDWRPDFKNFPFLYEWNVEDNSLSVKRTKNFVFKAMHSYLVQNGNAIYWDIVSGTPASVARRQREEADREYSWLLTLTHKDEIEDQTYIRMTDDETVTDGFDFGQDLAKELNVGRADIYSFIGNERAAANSLTLHTEDGITIPLGLHIEQAGDYTFAMPEGTDGVGVTLIDTEADTRTLLSALDYTVHLNKGTINERFLLEISAVSQTTTDIETVTDEVAPVTGARKVLIDGQLYIVKDGVMYDARGARVE